MPNYREKLKSYSDRLKSIPPLLGASAAGYSFRRIMNEALPSNRELAKTPNIQLDELGRPSIAFLLNGIMNNLVHKIDEKDN